MNMLSGSTRLVTMTIGHFSWCIVISMLVGAALGIACYLLARFGTRNGDDQ